MINDNVMARFNGKVSQFQSCSNYKVAFPPSLPSILTFFLGIIACLILILELRNPQCFLILMF